MNELNLALDKCASDECSTDECLRDECSRDAALWPDTPCVAVCSTTFDEICRGCGRTVHEVATWVVMDDVSKELVWQRILSQGYPRKSG